MLKINYSNDQRYRNAILSLQNKRVNIVTQILYKYFTFPSQTLIPNFKATPCFKFRNKTEQSRSVDDNYFSPRESSGVFDR